MVGSTRVWNLYIFDGSKTHNTLPYIPDIYEAAKVSPENVKGAVRVCVYTALVLVDVWKSYLIVAH